MEVLKKKYFFTDNMIIFSLVLMFLMFVSMTLLFWQQHQMVVNLCDKACTNLDMEVKSNGFSCSCFSDKPIIKIREYRMPIEEIK